MINPRYCLCVLDVNGETEVTWSDGEPTVQQLNDAVEGYFQLLYADFDIGPSDMYPGYTKYMDVYCNEEGLSAGLPLNQRWLKEEEVHNGFSAIYGDIAIVYHWKKTKSKK